MRCGHDGAWRLFACAVLLGSLAGCGGSSSETPPPLEPDLQAPPPSGSARPAQPHVVQQGQPVDTPLGEPASPQEPAPTTWGAGGAPPVR